MRRLILFCALLFCCVLSWALEKHSPWQVGIRTGVVISDMIYTSSTYDAYKYQFYGRGNIGLWIQREWGGFSLRPEVAITGRGTIRKTDDIYYALMPRYVDVRLTFRYTFLRDKIVQPYIFLTPNFNIALNGNLKYTDPTTKVARAMTKSDIAPYNFGTMLGVGMRFPMILNRKPFYLSVDAGYNFGFLDTYSTDERDGTIAHVGSQSAAEGHRYSSNVELAMGLGIPFSSFGKVHKNKYRSNTHIHRTHYPPAAVQSASRRVEYHEPTTTQPQQNNLVPSGDQLTRKMNAYNFNLPPEERVSNNVKLAAKSVIDTLISADGVPTHDIHLIFAYEVLPTATKIEADDYPVGEYLVSSSKACMATLNYLRGQLLSDAIQQYLNTGRRVTIRITGETDATPVVGTIPYGGEYGTVTNQICHIDNRVGEMSVSPRSGITTNAQLGFLRTQGVKHFLQHYVEPLSRTNNSYEYYVVQRKEKGAQYRRVAIEIIIHDVQ